jgi:uroporphyrinogen-III synthase
MVTADVTPARAATEPPGTGAPRAKHALVTRPREDSHGIATALAELGFTVQVEPLLEIRPVADAQVDPDGLQGILATSANGIRALARALPDRDLPVWAVGDASARTARELGYRRVESAGGDVDSLAALVAERCRPQDGALLHAAGSVTAGDLSGRLGQAGFTVRRVVLYRAETADCLSDTLTRSLNDGTVDVALFFSPRTAATFATLVNAAGLGETAGRIFAYALSQAVARELSALPWAGVHVAAAPTQAALLALLQTTTDRGSSMTETDAPKPATPPSGDPARPETEIAAPAKGSSAWAVIVAAILAALIGVAAVTYESWKSVLDLVVPTATVAPLPLQNTDGLRTELTALRERLSQLESRAATGRTGADPSTESRLAQAEGAIKVLQAQPQVPARLATDLQDLAGQLAELKRTSADAAAVLRLTDRLEKSESRLAELESKRASAVALLLAVGQLREALAASLPFESELRAVKALGTADEEIVRAADILKARAAGGLPTRAVLVSRFHALAPAIVRADILPTEMTWWRQTLDRLATLVTVRREDGDAVGEDSPALVARATARLGEGDLAAALAELSRLQGGAAAVAEPWLTDARDRLAADRAVSEMTAHVVAAIGAKP